MKTLGGAVFIVLLAGASFLVVSTRARIGRLDIEIVTTSPSPGLGTLGATTVRAGTTAPEPCDGDVVVTDADSRRSPEGLESYARVAGRLLVNGREPVAPIEIGLTSNESDRASVITQDGHFEFLNLPPDWSGSLLLPRELMLENDRPYPDDPDGQPECKEFFGFLRYAHRTFDWPEPREWTIDLDHPDPALEIRVVETPAIRGRLRRPPDGCTTGGGRANAWFGENRICLWFRTDTTGRFSFRVPPRADRISLHVWDQDGLGTREIGVEGPFEGIHDLGDLDLGAVHLLAFHVVDDAARPVTGAVAIVGGTRSTSEPTDETGNSSLLVDDVVEAIVVGKAGYLATTVRLRAAEGLSDIVLHPASLLSIQTTLADGSTPTEGVYVNLSAQTTEMFEEIDYADRVYALTGASIPIYDSHFDPGDQSSLGFKPGPDGNVVVAGLRPGMTISVQLRTLGFERLLDHASIVTASLGLSSVTLHARVPLIVLRGTVRDSSGLPIESAGVALTEPGADFCGASVETAADGGFTIANVTTPTASVLVTKDGFADLELSIAIRPQNPMDFVLRRLSEQ